MDETKVKDVFAKHIIKLRKNRSMTQGDFAELLKVGVSTVSDWETGKKLPRAGVIEKLARTFNISKSSLFEEEGENKNPDSLANELGFEDGIDIEKLINKKLNFRGRILTQEEKEKYLKMAAALFE